MYVVKRDEDSENTYFLADVDIDGFDEGDIVGSYSLVSTDKLKIDVSLEPIKAKKTAKKT